MKGFWSFILLFFCGNLFAYTEVPALVNLNILLQSDTFGFNLVKELPPLTYQLINDNKVTLWDSPKKNTRISPSSLKAMEDASGTRFEQTYNLFLHEFWTSNRKKTSFVILGLSFMNETEKKERISYGYVDMNEILPYLVATQIECNVNGPASLTFIEALYSRNYHFNLVQFGKKDFKKNTSDAIKIKEKAFYSDKKIEGKYEIPKTKKVAYFIKADKNEPGEAGQTLYANIQEYLNKNREVFFNIGGRKYYDPMNYGSEIVVTGIEVVEVWVKTPGFIDYKVQQVIIYANNKPLDPLSIEVVNSWQILFNFRTMEDALKEKKFKYDILKVNNTYVSEIDSPKYLKALEKFSWSQVSRYVQFY